MEMNDEFEMKIKGLALDPVNNMPIIILAETEGNRTLPIWIGIFEANAIALEMENVETPRPMTHDLIMNIFESLAAKMSRVVVHDLRDNTFFASIIIEVDGKERNIDSRPSDAIALALRGKVPIFVTRNVIEKSQTIEVSDEQFNDTEIKKWLENIKPGDFGKYPM